MDDEFYEQYVEDDPDDFDFITLRSYDQVMHRKSAIDKRLMDSSIELQEAIDKLSSKKPQENQLVQLQVRDDPDDATNLMSSEQETKLKSFNKDLTFQKTRFTQPRISQFEPHPAPIFY